MDLLREFCSENVELVPQALAAGAGRVELCDNLARGGTTPSAGVIRAACDLARPYGVGVMVMVRPRGGDFAYSAAELAIMRDDIAWARELGAAGVVFGCERGGRLDEGATAQLLEAAHAPGERRLDVTFHMAFDEIAPDAQGSALAWLAARGVARVLTHGGPLGTPVGETLDRLAELVALGRELGVGVLPGGGITWENAESVAGALGVREVHGTRVVRLGQCEVGL